jgi:hypothetical protein
MSRESEWDWSMASAWSPSGLRRLATICRLPLWTRSCFRLSLPGTRQSSYVARRGRAPRCRPATRSSIDRVPWIEEFIVVCTPPCMLLGPFCVCLPAGLSVKTGQERRRPGSHHFPRAGWSSQSSRLPPSGSSLPCRSACRHESWWAEAAIRCFSIRRNPTGSDFSFDTFTSCGGLCG